MALAHRQHHRQPPTPPLLLALSHHPARDRPPYPLRHLVPLARQHPPPLRPPAQPVLLPLILLPHRPRHVPVSPLRRAHGRTAHGARDPFAAAPLHAIGHGARRVRDRALAGRVDGRGDALAGGRPRSAHRDEVPRPHRGYGVAAPGGGLPGRPGEPGDDGRLGVDGRAGRDGAGRAERDKDAGLAPGRGRAAFAGDTRAVE